MYIRRKVFSTFIDTETGEERLFSTTEIMSEESYLEGLFSESESEQKEFARRDYEGLNEVERKILKNKRSEYAKGLRKAYRSSMDGISRLDPSSEGMKTTLKIDGGGVTSNVKQITSRGLFDSKPITELHKNGVRDTLINKTLPEAKQMLRKNSIEEAKQVAARTAKLKTAGKIGLGVAGAAGVGYGIKKAIDKNKKKKEDKK